MAVTDTLDQWRSSSTGYLNAQIETQIDALGKRINASGGTLHAVAKQLGEDPNLAPLAPLVTQGAHRVESFGAAFAGRDAAAVWNDAQSFARKQPWLATLAAGAAGFALSRAVKASARANAGDTK